MLSIYFIGTIHDNVAQIESLDACVADDVHTLTPSSGKGTGRKSIPPAFSFHLLTSHLILEFECSCRHAAQGASVPSGHVWWQVKGRKKERNRFCQVGTIRPLRTRTSEIILLISTGNSNGGVWDELNVQVCWLFSTFTPTAAV